MNLIPLTSTCLLVRGTFGEIFQEGDTVNLDLVSVDSIY